MKTIVFFNNKGGVGKTSMVFHLAWMLRELGLSVLAADLDPQSNLTSAFLSDDELERIWPDSAHHPRTMLGGVQRLADGLGDIEPPEPWAVAERLDLIPGDLGLSLIEDFVSKAWSDSSTANRIEAGRGFRLMTAFWRVLQSVGRQTGADVALIDVGPSAGALNRAVLVASDYVVVPLGADLFSLQGLRNLGPTLARWRDGWADLRCRPTVPADIEMPHGGMAPLGYVLLNPSVRENRPVKAYRKWADRVPAVYASDVLGVPSIPASSPEEDPNCLAMLKHFKSLMPMAQDARKPMFALRAADGAIGGHAAAVQDCFDQFHGLAIRILHEAAIAWRLDP